MKTILFITTGGTIASAQSEEGLVPSLSSEELLKYIGTAEEDVNIICEDLLRLDSTNIQPEEWCLIAKRVSEVVDEVDGIVLTHGTDTMAYTGSALSFMLRNLPIPLILTGSQLPLVHPLSDGFDNIRVAFAAAMSSLKGVYIAFNRKVMLATRAVKVRTMGFDAFESINEIPVGMVDARGLHIRKELMVKQHGDFCLDMNICKDVFLIKLTPGMNPQIFDVLLQMNYKGVIVEAFGAGGINFIRRDLIAKLEMLLDAGISVVVCSQCLYEHSDFSIYQTGVKVLEKGVIQAFDMTSEACVAKLMWALGHCVKKEEIKQVFETNYVNEISVR